MYRIIMTFKWYDKEGTNGQLERKEDRKYRGRRDEKVSGFDKCSYSNRKLKAKI